MAEGTRVIVKLDPEQVTLPYEDGAESLFEGINLESWDDLRRQFPGEPLSLDRLVDTETEAQLNEFMATAQQNSGETPPDVLTFRAVPVSDSDNALAMAESIRTFPFVEYAYVESELKLASFDPSNEEYFPNQGYLRPAPDGINAPAAWVVPGGDGTGVQLLDLERGWDLDHPDLTDAGVQELNASGPEWQYHATACLGIVLAQVNDQGVVGIVPEVQGAIANSGLPRLVNLFPIASRFLLPGDVLLIEEQTVDEKPVEIEPHHASYIRVLGLTGIVVIEPAGNGGHNLDNLSRLDGTGFVPDQDNYFDSLAIMVGARESGSQNATLSSCKGQRIDCHAWGENIVTTSFNANPPYMGLFPELGDVGFDGTSGASAIIAGVAASVQGIARAMGKNLTFEMRGLLSNPAFSTASNDSIGRMPDLEQIVQNIP